MSPQFTNPVYPEYFADPFVWKHQGVYYAIGTGVVEAHSDVPHGVSALTRDGQPGVFLILRSDNLASWTPVCSALATLAPDYGDAYWAPEIAAVNGKFYLYYSVGRGDKAHHIRVALSDQPEGPYRDMGVRVTDPFICPFAIDASPFQDDDGQWYLFYARDMLDGDRVGTAVVVDRLQDMTRLEGQERIVVRARHDWQRFIANRIMYGGVYDWHTIEGPCGRKRNGRYYCLFSAGRWENETYGVDFAVADNVLGPYRCDSNDSGARLLRTLPGKVLGPGHNSMIEGPDGSTDYIVYHAWDPKMTARRMCLDRLKWTPEGPTCDGPTVAPQTLL
jgi:beta-xylosidase